MLYFLSHHKPPPQLRRHFARHFFFCIKKLFSISCNFSIFTKNDFLPTRTLSCPLIECNLILRSPVIILNSGFPNLNPVHIIAIDWFWEKARVNRPYLFVIFQVYCNFPRISPHIVILGDHRATIYGRPIERFVYWSKCCMVFWTLVTVHWRTAATRGHGKWNSCLQWCESVLTFQYDHV